MISSVKLVSNVLKHINDNNISDAEKVLDSYLQLYMLKQLNNNWMYLNKIENQTPELINIALKQNSDALKYVHKKFLTPELILKYGNEHNICVIKKLYDDEPFKPIGLNGETSTLVYVEPVKSIDLNGETSTLVDVEPVNVELSGSNGKEMLTQNNNELCNFAINNRGLRYIPKEILNSEMILNYIKKYPNDLIYIPKELQTLEIIKIPVIHSGINIQYVRDDLITAELCNLAIKNTKESIKYFDKKFQTKIMVKNCIYYNINLFTYIDDSFKTDVLCEYVINLNGEYLNCVPTYLITKQMCKKAMLKNGLLEHVPKGFITQKIVNSIPIQNIYKSYKYIPVHMFNKKMIMELLKSHNEHFLDEVIKNITPEYIFKIIDKDDIISILKNDCSLLKYIPLNIQNNMKETIINYFFKTNDLFEYINPEFLTHEIIVIKLYKCGSLKYIPLKYHNDKLILCALSLSKENIKYVKNANYLINNNLCIVENNEFNECVICSELKEYYYKYECKHEVCFECKDHECYYKCNKTNDDKRDNEEDDEDSDQEDEDSELDEDEDREKYVNPDKNNQLPKKDDIIKIYRNINFKHTNIVE